MVAMARMTEVVVGESFIQELLHSQPLLFSSLSFFARKLMPLTRPGTVDYFHFYPATISKVIAEKPAEHLRTSNLTVGSGCHLRNVFIQATVMVIC